MKHVVSSLILDSFLVKVVIEYLPTLILGMVLKIVNTSRYFSRRRAKPTGLKDPAERLSPESKRTEYDCKQSVTNDWALSPTCLTSTVKMML